MRREGEEEVRWERREVGFALVWLEKRTTEKRKNHKGGRESVYTLERKEGWGEGRGREAKEERRKEVELNSESKLTQSFLDHLLSLRSNPRSSERFLPIRVITLVSRELDHNFAKGGGRGS